EGVWSVPLSLLVRLVVVKPLKPLSTLRKRAGPMVDVLLLALNQDVWPFQSVAAGLAEEMRVTLGEEVGYTIRFEDVTNPDFTRTKFLTDGVLLREMMDDPLLSKYRCCVIMVDEAHERSLATDILLGLLKKIQCCRPKLRLIIASATFEAKSMAEFFHTMFFY
nr:probable pre-mRNA-splicing factor ATP-dependent RNA helicase DEAH9 [Tanacetum cinerariifolium]